MPALTFPTASLRTLVGRRLSLAEVRDVLPRLGGEVESATEAEVSVEYFPDRPDLLSVEGVARAVRAYLGIEPGLKEYPVAKPRTRVAADPRGNPRPHIVMAYARGAAIDEEGLQWLIALQERLDQGVGRRRKRVAIGVHDAAPVKAPFTYRAVEPRSVRFVPLQHGEEMDLAQILERHPKGVAFRHLLAGAKRFPVITDANGSVLSFPPVINGTLTQVQPGTEDLLIDMTGPDREPLKWALAILATALADRGARLEAVTVRPSGGKPFVTPDLSPQETRLPIAECEKLLGLALSEKQVRGHLERMGHGIRAARTGRGGASLAVSSPAWRADILHPWDLVEDVAKGHGYMAFQPELPASATFGGTLAGHDVSESVRKSLLGLGFSEAMSLTLTNEGDQFAKTGRPPVSVARVANPKTEAHTILRPSLLPGLLSLLVANKHRDLPQALFEVGWRVRGAARYRNERAAAAVRIGARENFSGAKGVALALARDLGLAPEGREAKGVAETRPHEDPAFVDGRCAVLRVRGVPLVSFGELHPRTITAFGLAHPVIAWEIDLQRMPGAP